MSMDRINGFRGEYSFLSNFYETPVSYLGVTYRNSEAAFQAQKEADPAARAEWAGLGPAEAKRKGRRVTLRPDWDSVKDGVMEDVVRAKFLGSPDLAGKLLATGTAELVEENTWHDTYWGVDAATGKGRNQLGKTLMKIRTELAAARR